MKHSTLKIAILISFAILLVLNGLRSRNRMIIASDGLISMTNINLTVISVGLLWFGFCAYMLFFFFKDKKQG
jgi:hypothetical protein